MIIYDENYSYCKIESLDGEGIQSDQIFGFCHQIQWNLYEIWSLWEGNDFEDNDINVFIGESSQV